MVLNIHHALQAKAFLTPGMKTVGGLSIPRTAEGEDADTGVSLARRWSLWWHLDALRAHATITQAQARENKDKDSQNKLLVFAVVGFFFPHPGPHKLNHHFV